LRVTQRDPSTLEVPARRQRRPPAERRAQLLDAASHVFAKVGFAAATLRQVADTAGVSKGTVFHYFGTKESLLRAVVHDRVVARLEATRELVRTHDGTAADLVRSMVRHIWSDLVNDLDLVCLTFRVIGADPTNRAEISRLFFDEVAEPSRQLWDEVIAAGVASGEFRPMSNRMAADVIPLFFVLFAQLRRFLTEFEGVAVAPDAALEAALDITMHGLLAR
jgi:AcrR family transcriptional regulator